MEPSIPTMPSASPIRAEGGSYSRRTSEVAPAPAEASSRGISQAIFRVIELAIIPGLYFQAAVEHVFLLMLRRIVPDRIFTAVQAYVTYFRGVRESFRHNMNPMAHPNLIKIFFGILFAIFLFTQLFFAGIFSYFLFYRYYVPSSSFISLSTPIPFDFSSTDSISPQYRDDQSILYDGPRAHVNLLGPKMHQWNYNALPFSSYSSLPDTIRATPHTWRSDEDLEAFAKRIHCQDNPNPAECAKADFVMPTWAHELEPQLLPLNVYNVFIDFSIPSQYQYDYGERNLKNSRTFTVEVLMFHHEQLLASSVRSVTLEPPVSRLAALAFSLIDLPFHILGFKHQRVHTVQVFDSFVETKQSNKPTTHSFVSLKKTDSSQEILISSAMLRIDNQLSGLKYFMYYHFFSAIFLGSLFFFSLYSSWAIVVGILCLILYFQHISKDGEVEAPKPSAQSQSTASASSSSTLPPAEPTLRKNPSITELLEGNPINEKSQLSLQQSSSSSALSISPNSSNDSESPYGADPIKTESDQGESDLDDWRRPSELDLPTKSESSQLKGEPDFEIPSPLIDSPKTRIEGEPESPVESDSVLRHRSPDNY